MSEHARMVQKRLRGAVLLCDIGAAFPSVAHSFLQYTLHHVAFLHHFQLALKRLYHRVFHSFARGGWSAAGAVVTQGIRQGCPLSVPIFSVIFDVLLMMSP